MSGRAASDVEGTYTVTMGDRGRLVIPASLRARAGLHEGAPIALVETPRGVVLMRRDQLLDVVRSDLHGLGLVDQLLADRRRAASAEDDASRQ